MGQDQSKAAPPPQLHSITDTPPPQLHNITTSANCCPIGCQICQHFDPLTPPNRNWLILAIVLLIIACWYYCNK